VGDPVTTEFTAKKGTTRLWFNSSIQAAYSQQCGVGRFVLPQGQIGSQFSVGFCSDVIDGPGRHRVFLQFQFQPELLFESFHHRRAAGWVRPKPTAPGMPPGTAPASPRPPPPAAIIWAKSRGVQLIDEIIGVCEPRGIDHGMGDVATSNSAAGFPPAPPWWCFWQVRVKWALSPRQPPNSRSCTRPGSGDPPS